MSGLKEAMNAVRTNPKHAGSWVVLGEILLAEHQLDKATQSFQRALQLDPTNNAAQRGLAQILLAGNQGAGAPSAPSRPAPSAQPHPTARPTPPPSSPVDRGRSTASRPQARVERPVTPPPSVPLMQNANVPRPQRGVAAPMELRTPPPRPRKPSQGRVMIGLFFIGLFPFLCLCLLVLGLAKIL